MIRPATMPSEGPGQPAPLRWHPRSPEASSPCGVDKQTQPAGLVQKGQPGTEPGGSSLRATRAGIRASDCRCRHGFEAVSTLRPKRWLNYGRARGGEHALRKSSRNALGATFSRRCGWLPRASPSSRCRTKGPARSRHRPACAGRAIARVGPADPGYCPR